LAFFEFLVRAFDHSVAFVKQDDAVGDYFRAVQIVGNDDRGDLALFLQLQN
jgi:hypothetical protein